MYRSFASFPVFMVIYYVVTAVLKEWEHLSQSVPKLQSLKYGPRNTTFYEITRNRIWFYTP